MWAGRTRRKPIHGGSMAPSMAPTVLPAHTAPPPTDAGGGGQVSILVDRVDRRRAWVLFESNSKYSIPMKIHPRMAWSHCGSRKSVEGGVGPVVGVSAAWMPRPSPHGWVYGVSRNRTHPAISQEIRFCFGCCSCSCCCSSPQQVQGCKPCRPTPCLRTTDVTLMRHARGCPLLFEWRWQPCTGKAHRHMHGRWVWRHW